GCVAPAENAGSRAFRVASTVYISDPHVIDGGLHDPGDMVDPDSVAAGSNRRIDDPCVQGSDDAVIDKAGDHAILDARFICGPGDGDSGSACAGAIDEKVPQSDFASAPCVDRNA